MIIEKYTRTDIEEVEDLDATVRGEGGFGSTGVKLDSPGSKMRTEDGQPNAV